MISIQPTFRKAEVMPPVDSTPDLKTGNFELLYSLHAYDKVPVFEFKSRKTGLTVVIAEVDGPVVNGFFTLGKFSFIFSVLLTNKK